MNIKSVDKVRWLEGDDWRQGMPRVIGVLMQQEEHKPAFRAAAAVIAEVFIAIKMERREHGSKDE